MVVVPDAEQPGSKDVVCVREDVCAKTGIFDFLGVRTTHHLLNLCCLSAEVVGVMYFKCAASCYLSRNAKMWGLGSQYQLSFGA